MERLCAILFVASLATAEVPATLPPLAQVAVVYGLAQSNVCPQGSAAIADKATCKALSDANGLSYGYSHSWAREPVGCYKAASGLATYFNTHSTGKGSASNVVVCTKAVIGALSCTWTKKDDDEIAAMLMIGSVIGALFAVICIVFACLPLCCGIMKPQAKIIAGVVIAIGIFCCFIPAITGMAQADPVVNKYCERCAADPNRGACTEQDKKDAKDAVSAFGVIGAYLFAFGWLAVILGITAAALGCSICCKCCKMKDDVGSGEGDDIPIANPISQAEGTNETSKAGNDASLGDVKVQIVDDEMTSNCTEVSI